MRNSVFILKPEKENPEYSQRPARKRFFRAALVILAALSVINTASAEQIEKAKQGEVVYYPNIYSSEEFYKTVSPWFKEYLNMDMKPDIKLKLKTPQGKIEFVAELYNAEYHVACDWTFLDLMKSVPVPDEDLDYYEQQKITNYRAGDEYILVFKNTDYKQIKAQFLKFKEFYLSNTIKKNK